MKLFCIAIGLFFLSENISAQDFKVNGISYYLVDGEVSVERSYDSKYEGEIVIPDKVSYNNILFPVTAINIGAFQGCSNLRKITLPKSIKIIRFNAFDGCTSLESMELHEGIEEILSDAFKRCTSLKKLVFPQSLHFIDQICEDCTGLEEIVIPFTAGITYEAFKGCSNLKVIRIGSSDPSNVIFPDNVYKQATVYIPVGAKKEYITDKDLHWGWKNFPETSYVEDPDMPVLFNGSFGCQETNGTMTVNDGEPFSGSLYMPLHRGDSVTIRIFPKEPNRGVNVSYSGEFVQAEGDENCYTVRDISQNIRFSFSTERPYEELYNCDMYVDGIAYNILSKADHSVETTYMVPTEVGGIVYNMDTLRIPETIEYNGVTYTVKAIGASTFNYSTVRAVEIPNTVTEIKDGAFWGTYNIDELIIPNSVRVIGDRVFGGWMRWLVKSPRRVVFPEEVDSLGDYLFTYHDVPLEVVWPKNITELPINTFYGCPAELIPASIRNIGNTATQEAYYSLDGHRLKSSQKGINIIRMSDGTVRKEIVK